MRRSQFILAVTISAGLTRRYESHRPMAAGIAEHVWTFEEFLATGKD